MSEHIPAFKVSIEDKDLTAIVSPRLINLTLTLCRGDESDQLDISLDDSDGKLALPPRGAQIALALGWQASGLVDLGKFTVDEVEHSGAPDTITLRARSANLIDTFKQQQEHSFHKTTLGAIIEAIAFRNELASGVSARLRDTAIEHIDQTHESDAAFLRRLGRKYDAVATVKNDTLLFIPINQSRTASGKALPVIPITRALGDGHRYHSAESDAYTGVRAFWHDERYARRSSVAAGVPWGARVRSAVRTRAEPLGSVKACSAESLIEPRTPAHGARGCRAAAALGGFGAGPALRISHAGREGALLASDKQ